jgi:hypothetical protein
MLSRLEAYLVAQGVNLVSAKTTALQLIAELVQQQSDRSRKSFAPVFDLYGGPVSACAYLLPM